MQYFQKQKPDSTLTNQVEIIQIKYSLSPQLFQFLKRMNEFCLCLSLHGVLLSAGRLSLCVREESFKSFQEKFFAVLLHKCLFSIV